MNRAVRHRMALAAVGAALLVTSGTATAATASDSFTYGPDSTNWYWKDQMNRTVGVGPVAQVVRLPSPQAPDTLPVAVRNGELEKVSAIAFDLGARGVVAGSTITRFVLRIAEGAGDNIQHSRPDPQPQFNAAGKVVLACPVTGTWSTGDGAEVWDLTPAYDESGCVPGERGGPDDAPLWTFDLTAAAAAWSDLPSLNDGILFVPQVDPEAPGQEKTWQVNLKIPARDDGETADVDEYEETRDRTTIDVAWSPAAAPPPPLPGNTGGGAFDGGGGGGFDPGPAEGFDDGATRGAGSKVGGGSGGGGSRGAEPVSTVATAPKLPWYVWLLVPVGLVALATARAVLVEPVARSRPGGVIDAIRTRNAQLRGGGLGGFAALPEDRVRARRSTSVGELGKQGLERAVDAASGAVRRFRGR